MAKVSPFKVMNESRRCVSHHVSQEGSFSNRGRFRMTKGATGVFFFFFFNSSANGLNHMLQQAKESMCLLRTCCELLGKET